MGSAGQARPCKALCAAGPWATSATGLRKMASPSLTRRWTYTQIEHTAKSRPRAAFFADEVMLGCRIFFVPPPGIYFIIYRGSFSIAAAAACPTGGRTPPAGKSPSPLRFSQAPPGRHLPGIRRRRRPRPGPKAAHFRTRAIADTRAGSAPACAPRRKMPPMPGHRRLPLDPGSSAISAPECLPPEQGRIGLPSGSRPPGRNTAPPRPGPRTKDPQGQQDAGPPVKMPAH